MNGNIELAKYSIGVGDRFAHQAKAQLRACMLADEHGIEVIPVWNKSNREHTIIGSEPVSARTAADEAVKALNWNRPYHLDADHINLGTVDRFIEPCDFYTIDVADWIGKPADKASIDGFVARHPELAGEIKIPGVDRPFRITLEFVAAGVHAELEVGRQAILLHGKCNGGDVVGELLGELR
ncbi:MAG TPA: hypothetical protein VJ323_17585 [Bryobacteraceae bacterium]|nr:hypothetical protein [Bryobacteraceae bacterium]